MLHYAVIHRSLFKHSPLSVWVILSSPLSFRLEHAVLHLCSPLLPTALSFHPSGNETLLIIPSDRCRKNTEGAVHTRATCTRLTHRGWREILLPKDIILALIRGSNKNTCRHFAQLLYALGTFCITSFLLKPDGKQGFAKTSRQYYAFERSSPFFPFCQLETLKI